MRQQATQPPNRTEVIVTDPVRRSVKIGRVPAAAGTADGPRTRRPGPHGRDRAVGDSGTQGYRPASALFTAANAST